MTTRYDFRDNNNDLWHLRARQDSQGLHYELFNANQELIAYGLDMQMSFETWSIQLIQGMMHYAD